MDSRVASVSKVLKSHLSWTNSATLPPEVVQEIDKAVRNLMGPALTHAFQQAATQDQLWTIVAATTNSSDFLTTMGDRLLQDEDFKKALGMLIKRIAVMEARRALAPNNLAAVNTGPPGQS